MEILDYESSNKGNIKAAFTLKIPKWGNVLIRNMVLFQKNGKSWVQFPKRKIDDEWVSIIQFEDSNLEREFFNQVKKQLKIYE